MTAAPSLELRDAGDGQLHLVGYASVTNTPYSIGSAYTEVIQAGAFKRSVNNPSLDVVLLAEHAGLPLARTTSGTLALTEDAVGLRADATLDRSDPQVRSIESKLRRGDLTEMSFSFRVPDGGQEWSPNFDRRVITQVDIHRGDVSLVSRGANASTTASLRSAGGEYSLEQRRATAEMLGTRLVGRGSVSRADGSCARCNGTGSITMRCGTCGGSGGLDGQPDDEAVGRSARRRVDPSVAQLAAEGAAITARLRRQVAEIRSGRAPGSTIDEWLAEDAARQIKALRRDQRGR